MSDVSPLTTTLRYFVMLFNADFTLAGAYFAAFLKPWSAFFASSLVGVELLPAVADAGDGLAEPAVRRRDRRGRGAGEDREQRGSQHGGQEDS